MISQVQRPQALKYRAKKRKNKAALSGAYSEITAVNIFKEKSATLLHNNLRSSSLQYRPGKVYNSAHAWQTANQRQTHAVELTDDVIIIGRNGQRVSLPDYATLRIDQLPQFRKK